MATGIAAGPWSYTPRQLAGLNQTWEVGRHPLVYEESITSFPPRYAQRQQISPLTLANNGYYTRFGACKPCKRKKTKRQSVPCAPISKNRCIAFLQTGGTINPMTGRSIAEGGPTHTMLVNKCVKYKLINGNAMSVSSAPLKSSRSIGVGNTRSYSSVGVGGNIGKSSMVSSGTDPIFIGSMPDPPDQRQPLRRSPRTASGALKRTTSNAGTSTGTGTSAGTSTFKVNLTEEPKFILIGNKRFEKGSVAVIYEDGRQGKIIKIGPRQVVLWNNETSKERHLNHRDFFKFNKN